MAHFANECYRCNLFREDVILSFRKSLVTARTMFVNGDCLLLEKVYKMITVFVFVVLC